MLWGPSGFYLVTTGLAHLAQMGQPISCPLGPFGPDGSQIGPTWGPAICTRVIEGPQMGGPDCTHLAQMGPRETQMYPTIGPSIYTRVTYWAPDGPYVGFMWDLPHSIYGSSGFYMGPISAICTRVIEGPQMGGPDCTHLAQMGPRETQMYPTIGPSIYTRVTYWAPDGPYVGFMWDLPHSIYGSSGFYMGPIWAISGFLYGIHMGQVCLIWSHMGQCGFKCMGFILFKWVPIFPS